jgi:hypothetical protein
MGWIFGLMVGMPIAGAATLPFSSFGADALGGLAGTVAFQATGWLGMGGGIGTLTWPVLGWVLRQPFGPQEPLSTSLGPPA